MSVKWQPVMLVVNQRIECDCGSMAIFIVLDDMERDGEGKFTNWSYSAWCQSCWEREQGEIEANLSDS